MQSARRFSTLRLSVLRFEYWFDRQTEARRLALGLASVAFLGTTLFYALGIGSIVLVARLEPAAEQVGPGPAESSQVVHTTVPAPAAVPSSAATPTSTPAIDQASALIAPPDVPEVAIIPQPRYIAPAQPTKPRVVATPAATARSSVPSPAAQPRQNPAASPAAAPTRARPQTSPQPAAPTRTPAPARTATPARPAVNTPAAPPVQPRGPASSPTPRR